MRLLYQGHRDTLLPVLLLMVVAGCGSSRTDSPGVGVGGTSPDPSETPLRVAAASDLQRVLPKVMERFSTGRRIVLGTTFDASGRLTEQIKAGAPFDLFLSANRSFVSELAKSGAILPETVRDYAVGSLVLCTTRSVQPLVQSLEDLKKPEVKKIAIANPEYAPYGVAARQALERAGVWAALEPRIVRADSVRQASFYVQNGDAEAALVSRSLIEGDALHVVNVDPSLHDPLVQSLGVVSTTKRRDEAAELAKFILGGEGQSILHEAGFGQPGGKPQSTESH